MEIGQNAREHSSGSEISNWTTFPGKRLSSVLAEIPLPLVEKKREKKRKRDRKVKEIQRKRCIWGNQKGVNTYDLHNLSNSDSDNSSHLC